MPKEKGIKFPALNLDLLKPQSRPEKIFSKFIRWLLSSGRYILIFVEALVLIVFISRFKLDEDLAAKKDAIAQQLPYIESLQPVEVTIRKTQLKLSTISSVKSSYIDYPIILKKIASEVPSGVKIITLNLNKNSAKVAATITASANNNVSLAGFIAGLKQDASFQNVSVTSISLENSSISFSVSLDASPGI